MKSILPRVAGLIGAAIAFQTASAQFTGKLVYEIDRPKEKLVMTYYQSGTAAHVEAYNITTNNGVTDTTTVNPQDTILFDFANSNETHLQWRYQRAMKTRYTDDVLTAATTAKGKSLGTTTVTNKGADTANGYNCTHFVLTTTSQFGSSTRDVWVTGDLGPAPTAWVLGSYLYFTPGFPTFTKLTAAGANGIVVKSTASNARQGVISVMNLVVVDTHTPNPALFQVPSYYTVFDRTGFTLPYGKDRLKGKKTCYRSR